MKTGTPMQLHRMAVRFEAKITPGRLGGVTSLGDRLYDVRMALRTDKPLLQIAKDLGVSSQTLGRFIKKRGLCNLTQRHRAIISSKLEPME